MEDTDKLKEVFRSILDEMLEDKLTAILDVKLKPITQSLEFLSSKYDDFQVTISKLETDNKRLLEDNRILKN